MAVPSSFFGSSGGSFWSGAGDSGGSTASSFNPSGSYGPPTEDPSVLTANEQLSGVARLYNGSAEDRSKAEQYLKDNEHRFSDEELAQYGLPRPHHDHRSLFDKAKGSAFGAVHSAFGIISRPGQAVAHGLNAIGTDIAGIPGVLSGDISAGNYAKGVGRGALDTWKSAFDIQGKNDINARQMLNLPKGIGGTGWTGRAVGLADTLGLMATDPLSWVGTAGSKEAAEAGLKALATAEEQGLVRPGLSTLVRREGGKVLTQEEVDVVRQIARKTAEEAGAGQRGRIASKFLGEGEKIGGPLARFKEGALQSAAGQAGETGRLSARYWAPTGLRDLATGERLVGAERVAEKNVTSMLNRAQRGLKFGGQTIIGSAKLRAPFENRRLVNAFKLIDNPELRTAASELEDTGAQLEKIGVHIDDAEAGKTNWTSKASEALPGSEEKAAELETKYHELAQRLMAEEPESYVPPGMGPNPDLAKGNQDYLRHTQRLGQIEDQVGELGALGEAHDAKVNDLVQQLDDLNKSKLNIQLAVADEDPITAKGMRGVTARLDNQINEVQRQLDELDLAEHPHDKIADLSAEHERVSALRDAAADTPAEVYKEGKLVPNPELDTKAKLPVEHTMSEPVDMGNGTKEITAHGPGGENLGSINFRVDEDGVVQIEGIVTDPRLQQQGVGRKLMAEVERLTGKAAKDFAPGEGVEPAGRKFWTAVTGQAVDDAGQPIRRSSLARQTQEAEREMQKAKAEVERLKGKVGVTAEKQQARAEAKLERLRARQEDLLVKQGKLQERIPKMPGQVEDITPSRFTRINNAQTRLRRAFVTGSEIADQHGRPVATAMKKLREVMLGTAESNSTHAQRLLRNVMHGALGEDKSFADDFEKVYHAMETGTADELAMQYAENDQPKAAAAIRTLLKMNREDSAALVNEGYLPEEFLHAPGDSGGTEYMRRIPTSATERARRLEQGGLLRGQPARQASEISRELGQGGALKERVLRPGASVRELNADPAVAEQLGVKPGEKVIEDNAFLSVGQRRTELEHARAAKDYLRQAQEITDDRGLPLVTQDADLARTHGYVKVSTPYGAHYAPPAIAEEVANFQKLVTNDETLKAFQRTLDKTMRVWKAHATVPLIGAAFHARNAETNVMLNWIAGVENPVWYARSARLQQKISKAMKLLGEDTDFEAALDKANLSAREKRIVKLAQEHNVLTSGQTSNDLANMGGSGFREQIAAPARGVKAKAGKIASKANPLDVNNFLGVTSGHKVAGGLENNARLAHFMWALDKYGDTDIAAQSVKKYLFNYADLTPFEREKMKRIIPFYTFMRKNVGLMATTLAENPGKMSRFALVDKISQNANPASLENQLVPGYGVEAGMAPRKGLGGMIANVESPWSAAANAVDPFVQGASLIPGVNRVVPKELKAKGPEEAALGLLNVPGGPVAEGAKYVTERALDKDTYTGGDLPPMNKLGSALRVGDIFAPSPSKFVRQLDNFFQGDVTGKRKKPAKGEERSRRKAAAALNFFAGIQAMGVGDAATESEAKARFFDLQDYIDRRNKGRDANDPNRVPTIQELRDMGKIPSGSTAKNALGF